MDNEIIELHPPLVTFASIDYDGDPNPGPVQNPPPPAPYDHKSGGLSSNHGQQSNPNLVVVNRNDLESILVSKGAASAGGATTTAHAAQLQAAQAAALAAQNSAQNYHKQPIQPSSRQHGQQYRVSKKNHKNIRTLWNDLIIDICVFDFYFSLFSN